MTVVLFVGALAGVIATALLGAASLRLASPIGTLLAAYVSGCAEVVGLGEALSLVRGVSRTGYAVGEAVLLALVLLAWNARGRPRPPLPRVRLRTAARHPILALLATVVVVALAYELFLVLGTPPNNWDSLSYHLSRAAYWLQHGGVAYVPDAHTQRQNAFLPNSEVQILYTLAWLRGDGAAALPQFLAQGALVLAVAGIARRLGFTRSAALFAALLTATLAQVALQATTTQNDLTVAALVAVAVYFLLGATLPELALASVAVAIAVGTKPTSVFALPALLGIALLRLPSAKALAQAAGFVLVAFALFGAYGYVLNVVETGKLLGSQAAVRGLRPEVTFRGTVSTSARTLYRFFDLPGPQRADKWTGPVERSGRAVFDAAGIPANPPEATGAAFTFDVNTKADPDLSYFGPLGVLLVLPLAFVFMWTWWRTPERATLAVALAVTLLQVALTYRYNNFLGRFMLVPVGLVMPLAAWVYRWRVLAATVALVGAATLVLAHLYDVAKPTGRQGTVPVWRLTRAEVQGITRPGMAEVLTALDAEIPQRARVGVILGEDDWDYPLYGRSLERRLVPLPRVGTLALAKRRGLDWVVVGATPPGPAYLPGWKVQYFPDSQWTIIHWQPATLRPFGSRG